MKKTNKFNLLLIGAVLAALVVLPAGPALAEVIIYDGCEDGGEGSMDIDTLTASFDADSGDITVALTLCDTPDDKTKYRVHFDHTAPFADDENEFCETRSDDGMMHKGNKDTGPGQIEVDGSMLTLTYRVNMAELSSNLAIRDTILVWADTQDKGIVDRAPDTDDSDGCGKPEVAREFIELVLAPSTGCAAGDRYEDQGDGTVLDCSTDLVWLKDASCADLGPNGDGRANWAQAEDAAAALADGTCGLTDDSMAGEWRQPTIAEFCSAPIFGFCPSDNASDSLIDSSVGPPTVVNTAGTGQWMENDPFVGVQSFPYWSATENGTNYAWFAFLSDGFVGSGSKASGNYVWPVRGGQ